MTGTYAVFRQGVLSTEVHPVPPTDHDGLVMFQRPGSREVLPIYAYHPYDEDGVRNAAVAGFHRKSFQGVESQLNDLLSRVTRDYPPAAWFYVMVGHSMKVVKWYFKSRGLTNMVALNVSGVQRDRVATSDFVRYLQQKIQKTGGHNLLVLDYTYSGSGLATIGNLIKQQYPQRTVKTLALAERSELGRMNSHGIDAISLTNGPDCLAKQMRGENLKAFGRHKVKNTLHEWRADVPQSPDAAEFLVAKRRFTQELQTAALFDYYEALTTYQRARREAGDDDLGLVGSLSGSEAGDGGESFNDDDFV
ncbi:hypothetical protein [Acanthopleuribacter pedis]|uniref:Uncharacterized protein n=1 Tax=Acanthopleuribacter pedis TaxID=442870 RepID=A0A8J7Q6E6_9BACT|nr:hypothetical protein [Acanthopleuribacter pedis]MBO1321367.1 hypothetical protein [Acanthopleuribacter pedis]